MDSLKTLHVLQTRPDCPLGHSDLLVYSYLAYRQRHGCDSPAATAVSAGTGIHRRTVPSVVARLAQGYEVVDELTGKVQPPPEGWFARRGGKIGPHWSEAFAYQRWFVRRADPENSLTVPAVSVYSYLLCRARQAAKGQGGRHEVSDSYLSQVLRLDRGTVSAALESLASTGLVVPSVGRYAVRSPAPRHAEFFAEKHSSGPGASRSAVILVEPEDEPKVDRRSASKEPEVRADEKPGGLSVEDGEAYLRKAISFASEGDLGVQGRLGRALSQVVGESFHVRALALQAEAKAEGGAVWERYLGFKRQAMGRRA